MGRPPLPLGTSHGGRGRLFAGVRVPLTLGTFPWVFTFGHVRQLDAMAASPEINSF